jgi:hypothetical protein
VNIPKIEKPQKWASTNQIALVAIFAALFAALAITVPSINLGNGINISLSALIASIFGLVLGPYLGASAALLGSAVSWAITGGLPTNLPFIFAPMFNALVVGFIFYRKWKWGLLVFAVEIGVFLVTPPVTPIYGTSNIPGVANWWIAASVLFDKIFALLLIIPVALFGKKLAVGMPMTLRGKKLSFGPGAALFFFLLAFIGNQADNMWGSFIFATPPVYNALFGMDLTAIQGAFLVSPFVYPAIRIVQAVIVMVIAVPLIQVLKGTPWLWRKDTILNDKQPKPEAT